MYISNEIQDKKKEKETEKNKFSYQQSKKKEANEISNVFNLVITAFIWILRGAVNS